MEKTMKKVMIVDDSRTVRQQVAATLAPAGFEVVVAEDGVEGLERIAQMPDLALIFCDINMPRMDGLEMLMAAKQGGAKSIPVVMLSTEGRSDLIEKAKQAGATGWLVKPFNAAQLVVIARKLTGSN
jgi:two-component system, chemotaxis family, chemotaxis protein CheY